jgi:hypothetical protein
MKEPVETPAAATTPAPAPAPATAAAPTTAPAPAPATTTPAPASATTFQARFEGYSERASASLWQAVPMADPVARFAMLIPLEPAALDGKLLKSGGPENLALGTSGAPLKTADGQMLVVGATYRFELSESAVAGLWSATISKAP